MQQNSSHVGTFFSGSGIFWCIARRPRWIKTQLIPLRRQLSLSWEFLYILVSKIRGAQTDAYVLDSYLFRNFMPRPAEYVL